MNLPGVKTICLAFLGVLVGGAAIACAAVSITNYNRVIMGVQTADMTLAGMTKGDALTYFEKKAAHQMKDGAIRLAYGDQEWLITPEDIGLKAGSEEAAATAYGFGHTGQPLKDLQTQLRLAVFGQQVTMEAAYDKDKLEGKLAEIAAAIHASPTSAYCTMDAATGLIQKFPGVVGRKLDIPPIVEQVDEKLLALRLPVRVELEPTEEYPPVQDKDLANINGILASYTTRFYPGDRGDNIALAASHLNNVLLRTGETFSFNTTVGPRTAAAGYKDAGVIIDGRMAQDVGGGVCQVSSTLYNAILLANLTPTVRTSHFFPSTYCPPGLDATVADGLIDCQFQNRLAHNVYLMSQVGYGTLTVYVLGTVGDLAGNTVSLTSDGSYLTPTVYRLYSRDGTVVDREYLHTDHYSTPVTD
ncbi:MAG: VanW family protein [Selenomonadaceae bacterium]|nr:VanW family protein [Selenomonadaceae bacterium]